MPDVLILSALRTPIGKFGGVLSSLTAADMGVVAAQAAMERGGVEAAQIDETIFGCARQAGGAADTRGRYGLAEMPNDPSGSRSAFPAAA